MRSSPLRLAALSALAIAASLSLPAPVRAAEPARGLVVQLSPQAVGAGPASGGCPLRALSLRALPASVRDRFAALGVHATRTLTERLVAGGEPLLGASPPLPEIYGFHPERIVLVEAPDAALATSALAALERDPLVDWAERNVTRSVRLVDAGPAPASPRAGERPSFTATTLDTLASDPSLRNGTQYALWNRGPFAPFGGIAGADVHALAAWRLSVGSNALKLAVADTGIDPDHPELGGLMPDGSPRIVDAFNATDDPNPSVHDGYSHGTMVTGVIAARTNDGAHIAPTTGTAGVCGGDGAGNAGCRIVPIKITPSDTSGEASTFDIARALLHAADVGARAVNLSFAGDAPSRLERLALTYDIYHGCVPVAASGNFGFEPDIARLTLYPAAYARDGLAICVGASDSFDRRAPFSSYPASLDLVAPGLDIFTTFMTYPSARGVSYPGYVANSGTSFAAPHVVGAVGLLAAMRPDLMDTDFQHVIRETADDIGAPGVDIETAHGRLNLASMLARVGPAIGTWHDETAADSFTVEGQGLLAVGERSPGTLGLHFGNSWSTRLAAYATVAVPDTFLSVTGVWPRVGGTFAARGDFSIPYFAPTAEVLRASGSSVTFRGYLYRIESDSCDVCDDRYVPLAPSNVRFGFTVMGLVDRPPTLSVSRPAANEAGDPGALLLVGWTVNDPDQVTRMRVTFEPDAGGSVFVGETPGNSPGGGFTLPCLGPADTHGRLVVTALDEHGHPDQTSVSVPYTLRAGACSAPLTTFRATPSPFTGALTVFAPGAGELRVLDASGRVVRRIATSGGTARWDGHDEHGTTAPAGIYWVRWSGPAGTVTRRVVKLGR
jgi:subtilisin family serine protease